MLWGRRKLASLRYPRFAFQMASRCDEINLSSEGERMYRMSPTFKSPTAAATPPLCRVTPSLKRKHTHRRNFTE